MTLHIAVCDDESSALRNELMLIKDVLKEKEINGEIDTYNNPLELLNSRAVYNLIFLDIEMDELSGIETAEKIRNNNKSSLIFFVTNYEAYLDDAFNQHAFRFWTKPLDRRKLAYGIDSAMRELSCKKQFIEITANSEKVPVFVENIIYLHTQNKRIHIITTKGEIVSYNTYGSVFDQLKKYEFFFESFRGSCVNFKYIRNYDKNKIYCSYNGSDYEIYLSRRKREEFIRKFIKWMGEQ